MQRDFVLDEWVKQCPRNQQCTKVAEHHFDFLNIDYNGKLKDYSDWPDWAHSPERIRVLVVM